jgi:hypothetical protein
MNIFSEIKTKIMGHMRIYLEQPPTEKRPQDDVPDERVLKYVVGDYQRMFHERLALIAYIRRLENIYKNAQMGIFRYAAHDKIEKIPNKKRMVQELRLLLYDITKEHLSAQKQLRKMVGLPEETTDESQLL